MGITLGGYVEGLPPEAPNPPPAGQPLHERAPQTGPKLTDFGKNDAKNHVIVDRRGLPPTPRAGGGVERACVVEVKLSSDPDYLVRGYEEALLYRSEYAPYLTGWPKAILVASHNLPGAPREKDDVVAVGWGTWVPAAVVDGMLHGLV